MTSNKIYEIIKETVSYYIDKEYADTTNLLGITSVRNIVYILTDLENKIGFEMNDAFILNIKYLSVENLTRQIVNNF